MEAKEFDVDISAAQIVISIIEKQKAKVPEMEQIRDLVDHLKKWFLQYQELFNEAYLVVRDEHFVFYVGLKNKCYDEKTEDILTDLDLKVARSKKFNTICMGVFGVPVSLTEDNLELNDDIAIRIG